MYEYSIQQLDDRFGLYTQMVIKSPIVRKGYFCFFFPVSDNLYSDKELRILTVKEAAGYYKTGTRTRILRICKSGHIADAVIWQDGKWL